MDHLFLSASDSTLRRLNCMFALNLLLCFQMQRLGTFRREKYFSR